MGQWRSVGAAMVVTMWRAVQSRASDWFNDLRRLCVCAGNELWISPRLWMVRAGFSHGCQDERPLIDLPASAGCVQAGSAQARHVERSACVCV